MIINELLKEDPQVGDAIDLECGDVLIETVIEDITEDGIVVKLDETAMRLMMEARKQYIAESRQGVAENIQYGNSVDNYGLTEKEKLAYIIYQYETKEYATDRFLPRELWTAEDQQTLDKLNSEWKQKYGGSGYIFGSEVNKKIVEIDKQRKQQQKISQEKARVQGIKSKIRSGLSGMYEDVAENWGAGLSGKNDPIFTEKPLTQSALKVKKILQNFNPALYSEVMVGFGHGTDERRIKDHFKPIELALGKLPLDSESHREYDFLVLKVTDPSLFRLLLNLYFEYLKEYRDNSVFAQVFLTPKSNQQKQGMAEGTEDDLDNLNRLIDRTDANLSRRGDPARYDDVEVDEKAKIIYWVTQETTPAQSKEFAIRFAKILKNNGYNGWTVKVVRTDYWNGKRSPWRVAKTEKGVAEGSLNKNQEWDVYTVIQGNKADFKGSISAPDENSAIQAVYKDPRTYGYVSRAYAWVPFVKPKGAPLPPDIGLIYDKIVNSNLPTNTKNMLTSMITGNYPGGKDSPEQYYKTGKFSPKVQQYIDKINQQGVAEGYINDQGDYVSSRRGEDPHAYDKYRQSKLDQDNATTKTIYRVWDGEKYVGDKKFDDVKDAIAFRASLPDGGDMSITKAEIYVKEGRVAQLPTRGADYSKYDTDHLEMLLRPGILHRNELRFKNLIRKELEKRRQAKPVDPKNLVVPLSDVPVKKPRGHKQYDPAKEFPGVFKEQDMSEAEYQGRKVPLGKPMKGDVKKSKVYVKGPKGNVVKVNFGDKNMRIKKSNPGRRKSFRARHNCDNPGPRWKARYWSCRAW